MRTAEISNSDSVARAGRHSGSRVTPQLDEAVARCEYLIQERRPLGLVGSPPGCGKSRLLDELRSRRQSAEATLIDMTTLDGHQFLRALADGLGLAASRFDAYELLRAIHDRLAGAAECGTTQLLLLDHLDAAAPGALPALRGLLHEASRSKSLTIIAAARTPLSADVRRLQSDFGCVRIELRELNPRDTADLIDELLEHTESRGEFLPEAIDELHRLTSGQPRQIERLCELALLARSVDGAPAITPEMIQAAMVELPEPTVGTLVSAQA